MVQQLLKKYPLALLLMVSLFMLLPHLGLVQTNIMETRNLITAREMVANNDWIFTTLNGHPRYEKPPLPTWITAAFGSIWGFDSMFILRLPAAFVTLVLVYFFYRFLKSFHLFATQSLNASLILITSFYVFFAGRDNQWDIYCHAFMMVSIYYLYKAFIQEVSGYKNVLLSALFFGCSFLSKGPVSPYALFLPFLLSYFLVYKNYGRKNITYLVFIVIIGLIIGLSWPLYVRYFDTAHFTAVTQREASRWAGYNTRPLYYYWSFFTQSGIWTVPSFIALLYPYMKKRVEDLQAYRFSFFWTIFSVILLSVIPEKKSRYLLPVLIPLAFNTSFYIQYLIHKFKEIKERKELVSINFTFGLIGLIAIAIPIALAIITGMSAAAYIVWIILSSIVSVVCGIVIFKGLISRNFTTVFYSTIAFMCGMIVFGIPVSKAFYNNPAYLGADKLHAYEKKYQIKTYGGDGFVPEIGWDYGKIITGINDDGRLENPVENKFGLLLSTQNEAWIGENFKMYEVKKLAVVDLNHVPPGRKGYNDRLVKNYYLLEKRR